MAVYSLKTIVSRLFLEYNIWKIEWIGKAMEINVRKATLNDYEDVLRIMSQVQDMHVEWRPDVYKPNKQLFSKEDFKAALSGDAFYVAESE